MRLTGQRVGRPHIDESLACDVVGFGVPKAATAHAHAFTPLLSYYDLYHILIPGEIHFWESRPKGERKQSGYVRLLRHIIGD